jgi:hypothetical protein
LTVASAGKDLDAETQAESFAAMQRSRSMHNKRMAKLSRKRYARIDRFCLAAFPLLFLTFNAIYWFNYYTR